MLHSATPDASPACGDAADPGARTVRPTTTPAPPEASTVTEYGAPAGMRVCLLVATTHVEPGATLALNGANGPEASRRWTRTASGVLPGLNTSISEFPPEFSSPCGMAQWTDGSATPGTTESPEEEPENTCSSDATKRPVLAVITVLTVDVFCTSLATFSTTTWPGGST